MTWNGERDVARAAAELAARLPGPLAPLACCAAVSSLELPPPHPARRRAAAAATTIHLPCVLT